MQVWLQEQDAQRATRLREEVQGRLEELALIAARTLGTELRPEDARQFTMRPAVRDADSLKTGIYIEIVNAPDGHSWCLIQCTKGGSYVEDPCGSGPLLCS